jgi:prepilin-type N-terminal cleavage/methylation domain-containing protein
MSRLGNWNKGSASGFTLIELATVIVVIAILAAMITGVTVELRGRADKVKCTQNLKNLYTAAANYLSQQGEWPQIDPTQDKTQYAKAWVAAFQPMGLTQVNWICPTVQRVLNNPDTTTGDNYRIDYIATPFDDKPMTPYLWPHQPWFGERGSVHGGGGNLIIWSNGQIVTLEEALQYQ